MDDYIAVQQTLNRYTVGASRADWDAVIDTFLPDGIWEVPALDLVSAGHDAIRASVSVFVDQMDYFIQINSPAVITLAGIRPRHPPPFANMAGWRRAASRSKSSAFTTIGSRALRRGGASCEGRSRLPG